MNRFFMCRTYEQIWLYVTYFLNSNDIALAFFVAKDVINLYGKFQVRSNSCVRRSGCCLDNRREQI